MPDWDAPQYLRFERERTQGCVDLARRVELESPARIVDLGCGPGTSTAILKARWPGARLTGIDSSPEMLARARTADPEIEWLAGDIGTWVPSTPLDLVFSNAALHWLPRHSDLLPQLWAGVAPRGALAFQVPAPGPRRSRWLDVLRGLLREPAWQHLAPVDPAEDTVGTLSEYYDLLTGLGARVDLWDTEYSHVLSNAGEIVEWVKGTALRPVLGQLPHAEERKRFLEELTGRIRTVYVPQHDGRVLFPFLRRFVVAYRP